MKSHNTIYSIQNNPGSSGIVQIETVIAAGIYRFSILGLTQKYASDLKNKTYNALRSANITNLKSENRKITVNLIAKNSSIHSTAIELGVALSCHSAFVETKTVSDPIIAIGELSITGNIIPSYRLLHAISAAIEHDISYIACTRRDMENVDPTYIHYAEEKGIRFYVANTLRDMVEVLHKDVFRIYDSNVLVNSDKPETADIVSTLQDIERSSLYFPILISLVGKHDLLISSRNLNMVEDTIHQISHSTDTYTTIQNPAQIIQTVGKIQIDDKRIKEVLNNYSYTKIDSESITQEKIDPNEAQLSTLVYIHNLNNISETIQNTYYDRSKYYKIASCYPCVCGVVNKKCICLQRNILLYQSKLDTIHKPSFDMCIELLSTNTFTDTTTTPDPSILIYIVRSIQEHQLSRKESKQKVSHRTYDQFINRYVSELELIKDVQVENNKALDKMFTSLTLRLKRSLLQIARTLQDIEDYKEWLIKTNRATELISRPISYNNMLLAFSFIPRMDS